MRYDTTSEAFFENKYRWSPDPWNFEHSPYERERYATILQALYPYRYSRGFEPGCSIGVFTQALSHCCDELEAMDISATAVASARERCHHFPHVKIRCGALPDTIPSGNFDLVVLSEIGYYFDEKHLEKVVHRISESMIPGGALIAVHWLGNSSDHVLSGDQVHRIIRESKKLSLNREERHPGFRLDRMVRK